MKKIMFVCTGNICRSAMAHRMLEKYINDKNKQNEVEVYSCGIFAETNDVSTKEAIEVMKEYNVNLTTHRATNIRESNISDMDVILCATEEHKSHVIYMYPELNGRIFTMKEYAGFPKNDLNIKDPWGFNKETYRNCAKEIKKCIDKYMEKI